MRRLILAFIAFDGFARALLGQSSDQFASLRAAMHRLVDTMGSPSVAVAVAKDGRIVWEDAIGWANRERRIRSEERRVGKECRSWWSTYHLKKKNKGGCLSTK